MREFELLFCHRRSFNPFSWIIRKLQGIESSHCVIHWHSESLNRDMYYDSSIVGVSFKNQKEFNEAYHVDNSFTFETNDFNALLQFCIDNLHKRYSISLILYHFFLTFNLRIPFLSRGDNPICTTLAGLALTSAGIKLNINIRELDLVKLLDLALEYKKGKTNG